MGGHLWYNDRRAAAYIIDAQYLFFLPLAGRLKTAVFDKKA